MTDVVDFIIDFESGTLSDDAIIDGFQMLIDTKVIYSLQGSYQRAAKKLIDQGYCHD